MPLGQAVATYDAQDENEVEGTTCPDQVHYLDLDDSCLAGKEDDKTSHHLR